jgi:hypothetical protein
MERGNKRDSVLYAIKRFTCSPQVSLNLMVFYEKYDIVMNLYGFHISLGEKNRRIGNIATT